MTHRCDRRTFLQRVAGTAAGSALIPSATAALLAACGDLAAVPPHAPTRPRPGGSLTFAVEAEINSFDPRVGAWDATGLTYARAIYDPLFVQAADGSIKP